MSINDNYLLAKEIEKKLEQSMPIRLGVNKINELTRLVFEICLSLDQLPEEVLKRAGLYDLKNDRDKGGLFHRMKTDLLTMRYPSLRESDNVRIMPLKIEEISEGHSEWNGEMNPKNIFVEKSTENLEWTKNFLEQFPSSTVEVEENINGAVKRLSSRRGVEAYNSRRDNVFITANKASFIKRCPCTKDAKRCGYWILNLGFGCPFDCSYCYLQTYSNIPGIVLTANIEDYYEHIRTFDLASAKGLRIGTGEFTDSLALDRYTGYSGKLIGFFRNAKNLVLELKTKTADIENVLKEDPHENVVIAWSINTPKIAGICEKGASSVSERIFAAILAAKRGYRVAFHFDPVVWYENWEKEYEDIVGELFSNKEIRDNTAWISLGTLRYTPGLKQAAEQRFGDNTVFYKGEFFLDFDGKFRYPEALRRDMYLKMKGFIKEQGVSCWTYLCMEPFGMMD